MLAYNIYLKAEVEQLLVLQECLPVATRQSSKVILLSRSTSH